LFIINLLKNKYYKKFHKRYKKLSLLIMQDYAKFNDVKISESNKKNIYQRTNVLTNEKSKKVVAKFEKNSENS
jgi:hypothetical protein